MALLLYGSNSSGFSFSLPRAITAVGSALRAAASRLPSLSGSKKFLYGGLLVSCAYGLYACARRGYLQNMKDIMRDKLGWPSTFNPEDTLSFSLRNQGGMLQPIRCGSGGKNVVFNLIGFDKDALCPPQPGLAGPGECVCGCLTLPMQEQHIPAVVYCYNAAYKADIPGKCYSGHAFESRLREHIRRADKVIYIIPSAIVSAFSLVDTTEAGRKRHIAYLDEQLQNSGCLLPGMAGKSIVVCVNETRLDLAEEIRTHLQETFQVLQGRVFCYASMNRCPTDCPGKNDSNAILEWLRR